MIAGHALTLITLSPTEQELTNMIELARFKKYKLGSLIPTSMSYHSTDKLQDLKVSKPAVYVSGVIQGEELQERLAQARRNSNRMGWVE